MTHYKSYSQGADVVLFVGQMTQPCDAAGPQSVRNFHSDTNVKVHSSTCAM